MTRNIRDYGLGNYQKLIVGRPHFVKIMTHIPNDDIPWECPNCRLDTVAEIEVVLKDVPMLSEEYGIGSYLGCPACPFAAPMIVHAVKEPPDWLKL